MGVPLGSYHMAIMDVQKMVKRRKNGKEDWILQGFNGKTGTGW